VAPFTTPQDYELLEEPSITSKRGVPEEEIRGPVLTIDAAVPCRAQGEGKMDDGDAKRRVIEAQMEKFIRGFGLQKVDTLPSPAYRFNPDGRLCE
jgi:hypothetical protein